MVVAGVDADADGVRGRKLSPVSARLARKWESRRPAGQPSQSSLSEIKPQRHAHLQSAICSLHVCLHVCSLQSAPALALCTSCAHLLPFPFSRAFSFACRRPPIRPPSAPSPTNGCSSRRPAYPQHAPRVRGQSAEGHKARKPTCPLPPSILHDLALVASSNLKFGIMVRLLRPLPVFACYHDSSSIMIITVTVAITNTTLTRPLL